MMNNKFIFIVLGAMIYIVVSLLDRFLIPIDNIVYIPIVIIAILFMLIGIIKQRRG